MPLFSIIIPIYNTADYLPDCLCSVLAQADDTLAEIICINDGSTDHSMQVLQSFRIRHPNITLIDQSNGGLSAARNAGINHASGDYLLFLDSDDMLTPEALSRLCQIIATHDRPDIIAFCSTLWYPEKNGRSEPNILFNHSDEHLYNHGIDYLHYFVQTRGWGPSAACFYAYRRTLLSRHSLAFPLGLFHEDELFVPQALVFACCVCTVTDCLYLYRMRTTSIAHTESAKHYRDKLTIAHQLESFFCQYQAADTTTKRLLYSLTLNALLGLKRLHQYVPLAEYIRLFRLTSTIKEKVKTLQKLYQTI